MRSAVSSTVERPETTVRRGRTLRAGNAVTARLLIATVFLLPLFRESLNSQRALTRRLSWQLLEDLSKELYAVD